MVKTGKLRFLKKIVQWAVLWTFHIRQYMESQDQDEHWNSSYFIQNLHYTLTNKLKKSTNTIMLIMDNFLVYVVLKVNEFWVKILNRILVIAHYYPNLNPIKKVSLNIKSKTRSYLSRRKVLQLKMMQNSIYNTAFQDLSGFILTSDKEVIQKMKGINKNFSWKFENKSW